MADRDTVVGALLDRILEFSSERTTALNNASSIRNLAEAYAWLSSPNQPHGGQSITRG